MINVFAPVEDDILGVNAETRGRTIVEPNHGSRSRSPQLISGYIASEMTAGRYSEGYTPQEGFLTTLHHSVSFQNLIPSVSFEIFPFHETIQGEPQD